MNKQLNELLDGLLFTRWPCRVSKCRWALDGKCMCGNSEKRKKEKKSLSKAIKASQTKAVIEYKKVLLDNILRKTKQWNVATEHQTGFYQCLDIVEELLKEENNSKLSTLKTNSY